jgi:hypothetical protein
MNIGKSIPLLVVLILAVSIVTTFQIVNGQSLGALGGLEPSINFSIENGTVLYDLGKFSVGFVAQASTNSESIIWPELYSVSYKASWQSNINQVFRWTEDSPNPKSSFFCSIDLTNVPQGQQQIEVTVVGGGKNFGGGYYLGTFADTSQSTIYFNVSAPPPTSNSGKTSTWNVQTVDRNGKGGVGSLDNSPIIIDSNNTPHIAYTNYAIGAFVPLVLYASWNGVGWSIQTVALGTVDSLVLDSNNNPAVLFNGESGLAYASWTGSNWVIQTVDAKDEGSFGIVALDSSDTPHVAYSNGEWVKYASWTGKNWSIQTVCTVPTLYKVPLELSLAIDANNTPYILYGYESTYTEPTTGTNKTTETIKIAVGNSSDWSFQTPALPKPISGYGNMILDSQGYPHFICSQNTVPYTVRNLLYVSWDGTTWSKQTVASNVQLQIYGPYTNWVSMGFLALDSHDKPHITYTTSSGEVMYASLTDKEWSIHEVGTNSSAIAPGFLAMDSSGNPHIAYYGPVNTRTGYGSGILITNITYASATEPISPAITEVKNILELLIFATVAILAIVLALLIYLRHKKQNRK